MAAKAVGPVGAVGSAADEVCVGRGGRPGSVRWSGRLMDRLLARVAAGELLYVVLREAGMPTPQSVGRWARDRPAFGAALAQARAACGRARKGGGVDRFCEGIAEEVFERVCEGESLTKIGADPTMPCMSTLFRWRRLRPEFDREVALGMRIRAERMCDDGLEMAAEATPETAYLAHVKLTHLRWTAGVMAPRVFRPRPVEPEAPQEVRTVLYRHFKIEEDEETGKRQVVAYCPNPITGQVEREDTPGWRQAGDASTFSLPGGRTTGKGYWADDRD